MKRIIVVGIVICASCVQNPPPPAPPVVDGPQCGFFKVEQPVLTVHPNARR